MLHVWLDVPISILNGPAGGLLNWLLHFPFNPNFLSMSLDLFPHPRRLRYRKDLCEAPSNVRRVLKPIGRTEPEAYRLDIAPRGITMTSASEAGLFYAEQTLRQILKQTDPAAPPCLRILDWPVFPVRGFYHDVTRGKVPTLKTLLSLAEKCAAYKINQLQLYIEHTFAYQQHPEVWRGADPLTAEEIRTLDARCAELHIDLVPSFSTFGHFYTWIRQKSPDLNELERDVSSEPFCWHDRMMHYTLDCQNPQSIALVREIIAETRPLFRSRFYNICADETFDLGKGRNRSLAEKIGPGRLYVDFLKQIIGAVQEAGAVPMFWGDIIGKYPELIHELTPDAVILDWDYDAPLTHSKSHLLQASGRAFYICPGVSGWNSWLPDYGKAYKNITRFARLGEQRGACGLLNTDWGDYGHINTLGPTMPGLILGACAGWHPRSPALGRQRFEDSLSQILGDPSGRLLGLLREAVASRRATWQMVAWSVQARSKDFPDEWFDAATGLPRGIFKLPAAAHWKALETIRRVQNTFYELVLAFQSYDALAMYEVNVGLSGLRVMEEFHLVLYHRAGRTRVCPLDPTEVADRLRELNQSLWAVWLNRNKPSEFHRIDEVLKGAAALMENPHGGSGKTAAMASAQSNP